MAPERLTLRTSLKSGCRPSRAGFTLAESLVASVVLAIAVVAVSGAIVSSQKQNSVQQEDSTAIALARGLMEEIAARPVSSLDATPGFPTVTDRTTYDTINDFNGYTDVVSSRVRVASAASTGSFSSALPSSTVATGGIGAVTLSAGQYSRTVSVSYPTSIFGVAVASGDIGVVSVTVKSHEGSSVRFSRLFGKVSITR